MKFQNRFIILLCSFLLFGCFSAKKEKENGFPLYNLDEVKYSKATQKLYNSRKKTTPKEYYECWESYRSEFPTLSRGSYGAYDYFSKLDLVDPFLKVSNQEAIDKAKKYFGDFQLPTTVKMSPEELFNHSFFQKDIYSVRLGKFQFSQVAWRIDALKTLCLVYGGSPELKQDLKNKYVAIVNYALNKINDLSDQELSAMINKKGTLDPMNRVMREAACLYAGLHQVTGENHYAHRAVVIINRFADVLKHWQLNSVLSERGNYGLDKDGNKITISVPVNKPLSYKEMKSTFRQGIWGIWGRFYDLNSLAPLAEAYFEIKGSEAYKNLSDKQKEYIVNDLYVTCVEQHFNLPFGNHNQSPVRYYRAVQLGLAFNKPDWIHWAVSHIHKFQHSAYFRDGMWHEGTQHYAQEIIKGLNKSFVFLNGYSDPTGYVNKSTGKRFDNFDPAVEFGYNLNLAKDSIAQTLLPDGRFMPFEDTHWFGIKPRYLPEYLKKTPTEANPFLLGASKIGMMGYGKGENQVRLYLHFDGTNGHDHMDNPGISLWAANEEIMSETGYYGAGSFARDITAHNLVMVDEKRQPRYGRKKANWRTDLEGKEIPGHTGSKFGDWESKGILKNTYGNLTLWDTTNENIQVAEVDSTLTYNNRIIKGGMDEYRRTLILVRVNEKQFYILDVFRLKGGKVYDWMEHGNLGKKYSVKLLDMADKPILMQKEDGKHGKYLEVKEKGKIDKAFQMIFDTGAPAKLRTVFTKSPNTEIIKTEGHPIRTHKKKSGSSKAPYKLNYMSVRRPGPQQTYIAVHEVFTEKPLVKEIEQLEIKSEDDQAIAVEITLGNGQKDLIITSGQKQQIEIPKYAVNFKGKVAAISNITNPTVTLFGVDKFKWNNYEQKQSSIFKGLILNVLSRGQGDNENAFIVNSKLPLGDKLKGQTLFILDHMNMSHPYTISEIKPMSNGKAKIIVNSETGIKKDKNGFYMTYYPSHPLPGELNWFISGNIKL